MQNIKHLLLGCKMSVQSLYMNMKSQNMNMKSQNNGSRTDRILGYLAPDLSRKAENNQEKLPSSPILTPPCHSPSAETPSKRAVSSGGVTSAAAVSRKRMAATHCADWQQHRDAITLPLPLHTPPTPTPTSRLRTAFDVARRAVKALTEQTVNISAICPILFAFRNEAH